jgi:hypothetical protein
MLRIFVFSLLSLLLIQDKPTQNWTSNYRLQWQDFKANPKLNTTTVAVTASGLSFGFSTTTSSRGHIEDFDFTIEAQFYPEDSWYVKDRANHHILEHERLHFDITELHARKMRKRLQTTSFSKNINTEMNVIYSDSRNALSKMQNQYDAETNHSQNLEKQLEWQAFIKQELRKLAAYST